MSLAFKRKLHPLSLYLNVRIKKKIGCRKSRKFLKNGHSFLHGGGERMFKHKMTELMSLSLTRIHGVIGKLI